MSWFRWHRGTCTDPKIGSVARKSGAPKERVIAVWAMLLESVEEDDGTFTIDADGIADCLNVETEEIERIIAAFEGKEMIGGGAVSKWQERQFVTSTERVREFRKRQRNANETPCNVSSVSRNVSGTPPDTDTETDKEKNNKKEKSKRVSSLADLTVDDELRDLARQHGKDADREIDAFRDWLASKGKRYKDYRAAFKSWLRPKAWEKPPPEPQRETFGVANRANDAMSLNRKADMWRKGVRMGSVHTDEWKREVVVAGILTAEEVVA